MKLLGDRQPSDTELSVVDWGQSIVMSLRTEDITRQCGLCSLFQELIYTKCETE